jgi:signal transduction histidine kinase
MRGHLALTNTLVIVSVMLLVGLASLPLRLMLMRAALDEELASHAQALARSPSLSDPPVELFASPTMFVQAEGDDGTILVHSANLGNIRLPVNSEDLTRARGGQAWFATVSIQGRTLRTYQAPMASPQGGMLQVAAPLDEEPPPGPAWVALLVGLGVGVGVASAVGWYLARLATAPVEQLAATVDSISSTADLSRRVKVVRVAEPANDPIQRLAKAFNAMLERLQTATQQLEATLEAQRHFVADASHHLRTPLTSLRGNVHYLSRLCAEDCPDDALDQHQEVLTELDGEAERMTRLINNLLWLARADAQQHFELRPLELESLIQAAYRTARALSETVTVHVEAIPPDVKICGDADRLQQLLLILLDNAVRYSPPEGVVILRALRQPDADRRGVVIEVVDSGPGVPAAERELIFGRFYRSRATAAIEGSGLGLAVARWIAQEHGGELSVADNSPAGSVFQLWLPSLAETALNEPLLSEKS